MPNNEISSAQHFETGYIFNFVTGVLKLWPHDVVGLCAMRFELAF